MSAESPRHARLGGPLIVPSQPPSDRSIIDAVSGFLSDVTLSSHSVDPKDVIHWARFETADINEPTPEDSDTDIQPLLLILGYGSGVQVWLIPPNGEAQEVLSWRQGTVRVLRILPTPQHGDCYASKRPLIALCDSASPGPTFCSLSFISIRGGEQVKSIKFKNPILDVLANKRSIVVSFSERFAVFDAATLEDRMAVTTCYPCPCPLGGNQPINPLALGDRWLVYADKKLNPSKRSSGGCEAEGVSSYTATVLHAAKSLSKGLRGLGESVAQSLAGARGASQSPSPPHSDHHQPGVVTILDIENNEEEDGHDGEEPYDPIVAHFVAHSEAIIAMSFDASGMLLVTADRRGHDFHVFRINPHPCGPSLASVHHLYILHRGDTTAKVQDIALSCDSRWAAVSTLRGTTHVFAVSPYGGAAGVRTHTQPRVVNRLSRFHRSAGLPIAPLAHAPAHAHAPHSPLAHPHSHPLPLPPLAHAHPPLAHAHAAHSPHAPLRSASPVSTRAVCAACAPAATGARRSPHHRHHHHHHHRQLHSRPWVGDGLCSGTWFPNPRLPPYPAPHTALPLAQLRPAPSHAAHTITRNSAGRQRLSSLSEDSSGAPLLARAKFGAPAVIPCPALAHGAPRNAPTLATPLYLMGANGCLLHLLLRVRPARNVPKEKICDESPIEVEVEPIAQWLLQRPAAAADLLAPLPPASPLLQPPAARRCSDICMSEEERWLSQVEIVTHAGPHRRLWMGPQFVFKTYNLTGSNSSLSEPEAIEVDAARVARSNPVNMPGGRPVVPVLIDSDCASSLEHSPSDSYRRKSLLAESGRAASVCDVQLREDLAEAMKEDHGWPREETRQAARRVVGAGAAVARAVGPLGTVGAVVAAPARAGGAAAEGEGEGDDPDRYTSPNADEATFRPVARALAPCGAHGPLGAHAALVARPLPCDTTIPVQSVSPAAPFALSLPRADEPVPLTTDVVIPAALTVTDPLPPPPSPSPSPSLATRPAPLVEKALDVEPPTVDQSRDAPKNDNDKTAKNPIEHATRRKTTEPVKRPASKDVKLDAKINLDKRSDVNKDLKRFESDERKCTSDRTSERSSVETAERENVDSKSLPKLKLPDDIHPTVSVRSKKYPTPKSVSDKEISDSSVKIIEDNDAKELKESIERKEFKEISKEIKEEYKEFKEECKEIKEPKEIKGTKEDKNAKQIRDSKDAKRSKEIKEIKNVSSDNKMDSVAVIKDEQSVDITIKFPSKREPDIKSKKNSEDDIKTEEQAWDMLLGEPDKPVVSDVSSQSLVCEKSMEDTRIKTKKSRRSKKILDDVQTKHDEDSFVEIHTIEEKHDSHSGDLVSISASYEGNESSCYTNKTKKRSSKSLTPEKKDECDKIIDTSYQKEPVMSYAKSLSCSKKDIVNDADDVKTVKSCADGGESSGPSSILSKKKSKSLSPYLDVSLKLDKNFESERDIYVIDTSKEQFPDIQVTRGSKIRKKSPQQMEMKSQEIETPVEKPIKSWSSIAAAKSVKKMEETETEKELIKSESTNKMLEMEQKQQSTVKKLQSTIRDEDIEEIDEPESLPSGSENQKSSNTVSLQDKLFELCKRTDIMVAECDKPSELNFVEEHHAILEDLPPLDFGLDDFKLDVMRDSLLEANDTKITSPICKINIDDILSSIKETTNKVIESSTFNLIDLEKVPTKKEKGFSIIESDKITSQEVKIDDDVKSETEIMEKSSDDDNTSPNMSTDSDKEDRKNIGASKTILPSTKQSTKAKKSRRKKK